MKEIDKYIDLLDELRVCEMEDKKQQMHAIDILKKMLSLAYNIKKKTLKEDILDVIH